MAYRYTNTEKWQDAWFSSLPQLQMLLFMYLCDNCDIAGFIEVNTKRWASDLNSSQETIQGALKGLQRGLIFSKSEDCAYVINFLKHQKNLPLNPDKNMSHRGIIKRFELYSNKFEITDIYSFIEGASKGLQCPYGNGNGIGNGNIPPAQEKNWRNDFEIYKSELLDWFENIKTDSEYLKEQEKFNPGIDVILSIEKSIKVFWGTEAGWKNKKSSKTVNIDWKQTIAKNLDKNKVYKQNETNRRTNGFDCAETSKAIDSIYRDFAEVDKERFGT